MTKKEYNLRELTPEKNLCAGCCCPSIYELTPEANLCAGVACPSIHDYDKLYLIVGEKVDPQEVGLEKKVGEGEVLIKIKKEIIDNKKSSF